MVWIGYGLAWVSTAAAVSYGIYQTGHWWLLFFMLIPFCIDIHTHG